MTCIYNYVRMQLYTMEPRVYSPSISLDVLVPDVWNRTSSRDLDESEIGSPMFEVDLQAGAQYVTSSSLSNRTFTPSICWYFPRFVSFREIDFEA